jgi:hypothetical protein
MLVIDSTIIHLIYSLHAYANHDCNYLSVGCYVWGLNFYSEYSLVYTHGSHLMFKNYYESFATQWFRYQKNFPIIMYIKCVDFILSSDWKQLISRQAALVPLQFLFNPGPIEQRRAVMLCTGWPENLLP